MHRAKWSFILHTERFQASLFWVIIILKRKKEEKNKQQQHFFNGGSEVRGQRPNGNRILFCSSSSSLLVALRSPHEAQTEPVSHTASHPFHKAVRLLCSIITSSNRLLLTDKLVIDGMKPLFSASVLLLFLPGEFFCLIQTLGSRTRFVSGLLISLNFRTFLHKMKSVLCWLITNRFMQTMTEIVIRITFIIQAFLFLMLPHCFASGWVSHNKILFCFLSWNDSEGALNHESFS